MTQPNPRLSSLFELQYPQTVGIYDSYPQAQAAVDHLADQKFAVENLAIVGTDLKSVERVTGRRNWGTVMITGLQNGLSTGLMVTFILWFLQPQTNPLLLLPGALLIGILIGIVFAAIAYASSRGKRDFNSISQTVAAKYEVLSEHKVAGQARELLAGMPGARAAAFDPRNQRGAWPAPEQQQYPQQQYAHTGQQPAQPAQPQPYGADATQQPYQPQQYGHSPAQPFDPGAQPSYGQPSAPQPATEPAGQPYGSYRSDEGLGQPPSSEQSQESTPESDGRTPRADT